MNAIARKRPQKVRQTPVALAVVAAAEARRPVVLIRRDQSAHRHASTWAVALAEALHTDLVVVRLGSERVLNARARWQRRFGSRTAAPALLSVPEGRGTTHLANAIAPLNPCVVVVGQAGRWPGDSAGQLASECGVPCLVARAPRGQRGVVVATSLEDERAPVVREASAWARVLGRPLTVLHNQEVSMGGAGRTGREEDQLEALAESLGARAVLTRSLDPVAGILDVARTDDADLIVVGASLSRSDGARRVAPRISALAKRSVMIVPLTAFRRFS